MRDRITGVIDGLSNADYHGGPGYSKSQLDLVARAPGLVKWRAAAPRSFSDADHKGTAFHKLLLEPDSFWDDYALGPDCGRRSKAEKERWSEFEAGLGERIALSPAEWGVLQEMHGSAMAHPEVAGLLSLGDGLAEQSCYWLDPETRVHCRCRPDWWSSEWGVVADLKTSDDPDKFHFSIRDYRYDVQHTFYQDGVSAASGSPVDSFLFIVVGKKRAMGSYPVRVIELDAETVDLARAEYHRDLSVIAQCEADDEWHGVETIRPPQRWNNR